MKTGSFLKCPSPVAWVECVIAHFDQFLLDHAAAEKKAAGMALSMLSHYPDKARLVTAMSELAVEEMVPLSRGRKTDSGERPAAHSG